ncbi:MAG: glutamate synthase large chain [Solirubrobacteraceae bacterium]|jgi:glutamate synthase domain-containing protein 2/glutamate synthase domain-containing protein 1/glutamate synthase domain-containing protein 3|nr:glutamate synthase large chain [Solirubrobacteraceae bacterium]
MNHHPKPPKAAGLYDPAREHDACGVGIVARLGGGPNHEVVAKGVLANEHLYHRGATGADADTGDGAGILLEIPDAFLRAEAGVELPPAGRYGVAVVFLPREGGEALQRTLEDAVRAEGQAVLGWRDVPTDVEACGRTAREAMPVIRQLFVAASDDLADQDAFERTLYVIRRCAERDAGPDLVIPSFSSRTIVYKGMLTSLQLGRFYPDLRDERMASRVAVIHSRYSTNTFPSWELAHPYRLIAHNGEINTVMGNVNWMRARESSLRSELFGEDLEKLLPVVRAGNSDSATFDNVLELLVLAGRSLPHAMMMMVPEAYQGRDDVPEEVRDFYDFHGCLMEPWDGPAAVAFTDGRWAGATLDRNGLRPGRWVQTRDGYVVLASETGVLPIPEELVVRKGRLQPGRLFLVDLEAGRLVSDDEIKREVAALQPYGEWVRRCSVRFDDLPEAAPRVPRVEPRRNRQLAFGYSQEDLRVLLGPMAKTGAEPTGSMGNDLALAVLSDRQPALFSYFKQLFAQVTNPAIDPLRETIVMSLNSGLGGEGNLLDESPEHAHVLRLRQPILRDHELEKLRQVSHDVFRSHTIDITWPVAEGPAGMDRAVARICAEAHDKIAEGMSILILSDRNVSAERAPIPSLLAVASVHHHLVREGTRLRAGLVIESGEPREIHHMATLIGFGASAINPYLMLESLTDLDEAGILGDTDREEAESNVVKAVGKGLLKVLSKMGISTIRSYRGAQIFEAVGLERELVDLHFTGTASRIGGVGMDVLAREALARHARGYPEPEGELLPVGGVYQWRREGERRMWDPETIALLQHSVRANGDGPQTYERFAHLVNEENSRAGMLRGLLRFREDIEPVPLDEVEPIEQIVKRFSTGGMSLGALSPEAHETLAQAMNRLGGMSNTGEGGEDEARYGDDRRSKIKQVASGRFGVTINYLTNADQIQIKVAQGAKPGEGGQLPGHKVDRYIARLRHSTPGVGLISPPPHHDIYSIEDLKQLIYDLRCANPQARISVKLVAEVGVGTVAAGVAKANADHVTIAGHDGGTGASPQSSIQSAGVPWEIGLAETQQTLLRNDLRSRITVEVDGQMRTGRDVVIGAMLGADEFGFSTAPLIAAGCIMMRVCHLNTCPVGVATQDPRLRERFAGQPEHVVDYLLMVADETRRHMAALGVRTMEELIGRADLLEMDTAIEHWKARGVDLSDVLAVPEVAEGAPRCRTEPPPPVLDDALDWNLIEAARPALEGNEKVGLERDVRNVNRAVGGLLSHEIAKRHGSKGLPEGTIEIGFHGSAGQSFGAWLAPGVTFTLRGDANDYAGKGLSGGVLAVLPPDNHPYAAEDNVIVGNTVLYGATGGRAFFRGLAGERFAVRNSDASAVVEGVGDHGCEYMTGGRVIVLGPTGRNFAAGMSGGIAYVLDEDGTFERRCNMELVGFDEISADDARELRELVAEHAQRTGSPVAERVLARWSELLPRFVKVMPHDYKRALEELAREAADVSPQGEPAIGA